MATDLLISRILWNYQPTCLNCGDWIVCLSSSSDSGRFSTAGKNGNNLFCNSLSASKGNNASVEKDDARSTPKQEMNIFREFHRNSCKKIPELDHIRKVFEWKFSSYKIKPKQLCVDNALKEFSWYGN